LCPLILQIYNYQAVFNEDYNIANTPAPNGKSCECVLKIVIINFNFEMDKIGEHKLSLSDA